MPCAVPLSICAWTARRVAASILPAISVAVERMRPASTSAATSFEQLALLGHVRRAEHRPGEHQLPVQRHGLALEERDVELSRVVDQAEAALRGDQLGDVGDVLVGLRRREHEARGRRGRAPRPAAPAAGGGRSRGGRRRSRTQACVSGREAVAITVRSVSARASWIAIEPTPPAPPMMRMDSPPWRGRAVDVEPVEQHLPGGDRRQRQRGGLGVAQSVAGLRPTMRSSTRWNSAVGAGPGDASRHRRRRRPA